MHNVTQEAAFEKSVNFFSAKVLVIQPKRCENYDYFKRIIMTNLLIGRDKKSNKLVSDHN